MTVISSSCLFRLSERDRNFSLILSYELQFAYQKFFLLATCCNDLLLLYFICCVEFLIVVSLLLHLNMESVAKVEYPLDDKFTS